jgi:hypothetical protein
MIKDDTNIEFKNDKRVLGYWEVYDFIDYDEKDTYKPSDKEQNDYDVEQSCIGIKNLTINPNGSCIYEWKNGFLDKISWSKGVIIDKDLGYVSEYCIKKFDGKDFLIVDWKSGDYSFGGRINGAYVYKRAE